VKIAEVKVGQTVGVIKGRRPDYRELPREAEVVGIVTKEERQWSQFTSEQKVKKVRYVKVRFTTEPLEEASRYRTNLHTYVKGLEAEIEPQQIVGLWSALKGDVQKRIDAIRAKEAGQAALEARVEALIGKKKADDYASCRFEGRASSNEVTFYGPGLEAILKLAESSVTSVVK